MFEENTLTSSIKTKSSSAYRTIGEVAEITDVPQHVLRFWESKFPSIAPQKIKGRRYYRPQDIEQIKTIKHLLYNNGLTLKGVTQALKSSIEIPKSIEDKQMHLIETRETFSNAKELKEILNLLKSCKQTISELL
jgi:DNA-binding transcriptional MerR regulator